MLVAWFDVLAAKDHQLCILHAPTLLHQTGLCLHVLSRYVTTGPDLTVDLSGNTDFLCPVPSTSAVYDTATCTCAAGWYGAQGPLDGALWNASRCRNEISGDFEYTGDAGNCAGLSRFGCSQCSATSANNRFSAVDWASSCATCSLGSFVVADDIDGRRSTCVSCTAEVTSAAAVGARGCETCGVRSFSIRERPLLMLGPELSPQFPRLSRVCGCVFRLAWFLHACWDYFMCGMRNWVLQQWNGCQQCL